MNDLNQPTHVMNQTQHMNHTPMMNQAPQMLNLSYGIWPPQPSMNNPIFSGGLKPPKLIRGNWKNNKGSNMQNPTMTGYRPPTLNELQSQNRLKARKFYPKKKFNNRFAPFAPRNTSSYIIRAKKSGGIASLVSPCPVTPAVLPTPIFSPSHEVLVDMAKEEWGVDGYGSMKGLIRLRKNDDEDDEGGESSESDVEEHVEVERRLDHDLSRFEMIYPNCGGDYSNVLENRVDDQDTHIAHLEEENLTLKERMFLMEKELIELRRRIRCLEQKSWVANVEVAENCSENDSEGHGYNTVIDPNEEVAESLPEIVRVIITNNNDEPEPDIDIENEVTGNFMENFAELHVETVAEENETANVAE